MSLLEEIQSMTTHTLMETLGIEYLEIGDDFLLAKMPITPSVSQPGGFLHGGASLALAESVASMLSLIKIDQRKYRVVGLEISANHLQSKREGHVFAKAKLLYKGKSTHLILIEIYDENKKAVSHCKMTNMILNKAEN